VRGGKEERPFTSAKRKKDGARFRPEDEKKGNDGRRHGRRRKREDIPLLSYREGDQKVGASRQKGGREGRGKGESFSSPALRTPTS